VNDPGVNHRLITTARPRLIPVICLSLHPIRKTLPSLLLLQGALCPLFNPAERPGTRGEQIDLLRGPYWQCFCCCGQSQTLALHAWLDVRCWHNNKCCRHLVRCCFSWQTWPRVCFFSSTCVTLWAHPVFIFCKWSHLEKLYNNNVR